MDSEVSKKGINKVLLERGRAEKAEKGKK